MRNSLASAVSVRFSKFSFLSTLIAMAIKHSQSLFSKKRRRNLKTGFLMTDPANPATIDANATEKLCYLFDLAR